MNIIFKEEALSELYETGLHYEKLRHQEDKPISSVRLVNGLVERLLFSETDDGIEVELIEIDSTHYGNKK